MRNQKLDAAQEALRISNSELQEAARLRSQFLAAVSHELRTPLNAIIGFTSLTLRNPEVQLPEKPRSDLQRSLQAAQTLLQLINDVLDFSKIEAGQMEVFAEPLDLKTLCEDCLDLAEGLVISRPDIRIERSLTDLPVIESDSLKIEQILNNLIGNAVKFTEKGTVRLELEDHSKSKGHITVRIKDTGCGIPADKLSAIFEAFRQVDGSLKRRAGGTGLGLAITKKLADLLGIEISVSSESGVGSTFTLTIPTTARSPAAAASPQISETTSSEGSAPAPRVLESSPQGRAVATTLALHPVLRERRARVLALTSKECYGALSSAIQDSPIDLLLCASAEELVSKLAGAETWAVIYETSLDGFQSLPKLQDALEKAPVPLLLYGANSGATPTRLTRVELLDMAPSPDRLWRLVTSARHRQGPVLIVEDDANLAELFAQGLRRDGLEVQVAGRLDEARQLLRKSMPRAIVLDLLLPDGNGLDLLEDLPKNADRPALMIVTGQELSKAEQERLCQEAQRLAFKGQLDSSTLSQELRAAIRELKLLRSETALVVDDNPDNLTLIGDLLRLAGMAIQSAESGKRALELASTESFDLIILDLAMPDMDGFETLAELKSRALMASSTVIACSAFTRQSDRERAFEAGFHGYITKPIEPDLLEAQIRQILMLSKLEVTSCPSS